MTYNIKYLSAQILIIWIALLSATLPVSYAQNIVDNGNDECVEPEIKLTEKDLLTIIENLPDTRTATNFAGEFTRVATKLNTHINNLIDGWQWMPFHHTLGISGYEVYFNHPDEMFYALSIALPYLNRNLRDKTISFLEAQLSALPPYSIDGYNNRTGKPRESYDVPDYLRIKGRGKATSAFGVYSFWAYCHYSGNHSHAKTHWQAIKNRIKPLLESDYKFDIYKKDYSKDESEKLNGDLAGLIGYIRLAKINNDTQALNEAIPVALQLLNLRVNLERVNPKILTRTSATKSLHIYKLARYCNLIQEIAQAINKHSSGCAAKRIKEFRELRNGWYIAFGDRFVGGENYTNPLNFSRSLFSATALIEELPADTLVSFLDVPHCPADFYFIEKCALILNAHLKVKSAK